MLAVVDSDFCSLGACQVFLEDESCPCPVSWSSSPTCVLPVFLWVSKFTSCQTSRACSSRRSSFLPPYPFMPDTHLLSCQGEGENGLEGGREQRLPPWTGSMWGPMAQVWMRRLVPEGL